jgi:hypothetical protein
MDLPITGRRSVTDTQQTCENSLSIMAEPTTPTEPPAAPSNSPPKRPLFSSPIGNLFVAAIFLVAGLLNLFSRSPNVELGVLWLAVCLLFLGLAVVSFLKRKSR